MRHNFGTFVLAFCAFFGALTALLAGLQPARFAQSLGLSIANSGGINEVRAQYAGFFLACSLVCIAALTGGVPRSSAFIVLIVVFAGLISGRVVSLALNHGASGYPPAIVALYFIDSAGLILSITALKLSQA
jgi:Domain of unknown function (DUF4345)